MHLKIYQNKFLKNLVLYNDLCVEFFFLWNWKIRWDWCNFGDSILLDSYSVVICRVKVFSFLPIPFHSSQHPSPYPPWMIWARPVWRGLTALIRQNQPTIPTSYQQVRRRLIIFFIDRSSPRAQTILFSWRETKYLYFHIHIVENLDYVFFHVFISCSTDWIIMYFYGLYYWFMCFIYDCKLDLKIW